MKTASSTHLSPQASSEMVETLRTQFIAFRGQHKKARRIPQHLRQAVLAALDSGVGPAEVRCACGVTASQIKKWRSQAPEKQRAQDNSRQQVYPSENVRVLQVKAEPTFEARSEPSLNVKLCVGSLCITIEQSPNV